MLPIAKRVREIAGLRRRVAALELQQFEGRPANVADPARADAPERVAA